MLFLHGVHLKHHKHTADIQPISMPVPKRVIIPMTMHIGAPAKPIVKVGETVLVGQRIAEAGGAVSSPIYSSVSGKVMRIEEFTMTNGGKTQAIGIDSDGEQKRAELQPPRIENASDLAAAVRESGVVGLGGAGFPTGVKLAVDPARIEYVVVNGAECEPYITSDTRTMLDDGEKIVRGLLLLKKYLNVPKAVIGIENNKAKCIANMTKLTAEHDFITVKKLPAVYPQGGEKVLVYHTTGKTVEEGKLPIDAGVIVINCTTLAAITTYVETGMPLVEKCVTVDGSAVKEPKNVIVPIGTPVGEVFEYCGGFSEEPKKILYGGPMMGIALPDLEAPVLKQTNAILAFGKREAKPVKSTACIRCGRCAAACPFSLIPYEIETAFNLKNAEALGALKVNLCMECGSCSYVCPAKRNLAQTNKLAKAMLREHQQSGKTR